MTEKQKVKLCSEEIRALVFFLFFFSLQKNDFVFLEIIAAPKILVQTLPGSSLAYHALRLGPYWEYRILTLCRLLAFHRFSTCPSHPNTV